MSSLPVYHIANIFSTSGFVATVILNSLLIFLTVFHTRQIDKTYKQLLIVFATLCLVFSFIEMAVHPFYHSFNGGLINFNMVKWDGWDEDWITVMVASYSGVYVGIVSFFTVLFVFRDVMKEHYDMDVDHVSGYTVIAYDDLGNLRWQAFGFSFGIIFLMGIQFTIVGICGFQMHFKMNDMLKNVSDEHRRLQKQFFKSLVLQITSPTLTFYIPAVAILTVPFLNLKWSLPTGLIVCSFSIYPSIDSLILMLIVSDYRKALKGILKRPSNVLGGKSATTQDAFSTRNEMVF
ncbi:hypothetical protein CAEBREN_04585 [Caenorhabditis brenneri]|uniref:Seven TM Receptor n=1 Tax=Caenorhabditis brenneri TaxID=135651 RepID=G0N173_CAEBE|nr:hypothetical protein CAEBREN_04585 [Caenorhabditis brenneri]